MSVSGKNLTSWNPHNLHYDLTIKGKSVCPKPDINHILAQRLAISTCLISEIASNGNDGTLIIKNGISVLSRDKYLTMCGCQHDK